MVRKGEKGKEAKRTTPHIHIYTQKKEKEREKNNEGCVTRKRFFYFLPGMFPGWQNDEIQET
jgi:hypothetical protein